MNKLLLVMAIFLVVFGCSKKSSSDNFNYLENSTVSSPEKETVDVYVNETPKETQMPPETKEQTPKTEQSEKEEPKTTQTPTKTVEEAGAVQSNATNKSKSMFADRCKDSDATAEHPDGNNIFAKGTITINGKPIKGGVDTCASVVQVSEWYCLNGVPRVTVYKCPGNCVASACVE